MDYRRREQTHERWGPHNANVSKCDDTDEDDLISGRKIKDFNSEEWEVEVALPVNWANLKKTAQAATAINTAIHNQFPDQTLGSYYDPDELIQETRSSTDIINSDIREKLGFKNRTKEEANELGGKLKDYHTKAEVFDVLSNIRAEPVVELEDEEDNEDADDYKRLQFNLAIVRGPLATDKSKGVGPVAELLDNGFEDTLYLAYTRLDGRTIWGAMKKKKPDTKKVAPDGKQQGEAVKPELENQIHTKVPFQLDDFNMEDWNYGPVTEHVVGERRYVTAATGIFHSMENQYPTSGFATNGSSQEVLDHLDEVTEGRLQHFTADQGALALDQWTSGKFKLVTVERDPKNPTKWIAMSQKLGDGPELLVKYRMTDSSRGIETRWQPMILKKATLPGSGPVVVEEKPPPPNQTDGKGNEEENAHRLYNILEPSEAPQPDKEIGDDQGTPAKQLKTRKRGASEPKSFQSSKKPKISPELPRGRKRRLSTRGSPFLKECKEGT
jgi:hypothetical protein